LPVQGATPLILLVFPHYLCYRPQCLKDLTRMLNAMDTMQPETALRLVEAVYQELRSLARHRMAAEDPNHTLQPTALVHEAWLRLVAPGKQRWQNRAHFFAAAGEAMRRILVEHARRKQRQKRGGGLVAEELNETTLELSAPPEELLQVHELLDQLAREDPVAAELVKLRYFVGLTMSETAEAMSLAPRTAERLWTYARVWLRREMRRAN
jgi:RNA polymerase sigma factor (TIGR02999 family)